MSLDLASDGSLLAAASPVGIELTQQEEPEGRQVDQCYRQCEEYR